MRNNAFILGILLFCLLNGNGLFGQMTVHEFFNAPDSPETESAKSPQSYKFYKMPWIENVDIRTETDDFDFEQQEYTFRFSPNSAKKKRAQELLLRHIYSAPNYRMTELVCEERMTKYEDWLSLYLIQEQEDILNNLEPILQDNEKIINKKSAALDFDFLDMIKLTESKSDLKLAKLELRTERIEIQNRNGMVEGKFDFTNFISIENLLGTLESIKTDELIDPKDEYEIELLQKEIDLELAEGKQIFDFGQIRYSGPHSDLFKERLSLGIGINFPNSGNQKLKVRELELEQKELLLKGELDANKKSLASSQVKTELLNQIEAYNQWQVIVNQEFKELEKIAELASGKEGFDPMILIDIELKKLGRQEDAIELKGEIYELYLDYLKQTQIACQSQVQYLMN